MYVFPGNIGYSIPLHGSGAIEKVRPSAVSLGILNMMLPIITNPHMLLSYQSVLVEGMEIPGFV